MDGEGAAELGRASIRGNRPMGVVLVDAEAGSEEGRRLATLALRVTSPLCAVRWLAPDERRKVARRFDVALEDEAAVYLVWHGVSPACRRPRELEGEWLRAVSRAWKPAPD